jgi:serine/threonine protein kinase
MAEDVFGIVGSTQAGAYRVEQVVAEGGFAVVYRAYHEAFRAAVALKCLKVPDTLTADAQREFLERFREEGELLFRLSSSTRAVVRPLHVGILEGVARFVPFIALEWLEGETLDTLIVTRSDRKESPLALDAVLRLLTPVARALELAHRFPGPTGEICILHRDLKPDNVFIANIHGQPTAKVLDFGIGKVKSAATQMVGHQSATAEGLVAFTPQYGAPEQWLPKRFGQTGPWTDVWGFALTVLAAIIGRDPLEGDQAALIGSAIDPGRRPTPRNEGIEVSDSVERVFERAVAVDPRDRYKDVGVFWTDLMRAAGVRETSASLPPPAASGAAPELSRSADPMAATRLMPSGEAPAAPPPVVPELELAAPVRRAPAARPAAPERAPKITLQRDASIDIDMPHMQMGGTMLEDDLETGPPLRSPGSNRGMASYGHLDGIGVSPRAAPIRSQAARYGAHDPLPGAGTRMLKERLRGPIQLIAFGMLVMIADFVYASQTGELVRLGPVRPLWVAGPIVVIGIGATIWRLMQSAR